LSENKHLRLLWSDERNNWQEVPVAGVGDYGVAVGDVDPHSALVVWAGQQEDLRWGLLSDTQWQPAEAPLSTDPFGPNSPRLRKRPSGGLWLAWATGEGHVRASTYRDGAWSAAESLGCAYSNPSLQHLSELPELTRDDREYPSVAWTSQDLTGGKALCVCMSNDSGFGQAEELPEGYNAETYSMARDRNGDLWLAWWKRYDGIFWTHTHSTATTTTPRILSNRALRGISWTLSEPAPETWWAVLRSRNGAEFEEVARVRASQSQNMSWIDTSPAGGTLRYKIRRESLDTRYQWESATGHWPPVAPGPWTLPSIALVLRVMSGTNSALEISGASEAPIDVELYDLQGRRVLSQRLTSAGGEAGTIRFDLDTSSQRLTPGIYFARAREESGRTSEPAKLLILR